MWVIHNIFTMWVIHNIFTMWVIHYISMLCITHIVKMWCITHIVKMFCILYSMFPVSLDILFLISSSVFSNINSITHTHKTWANLTIWNIRLDVLKTLVVSNFIFQILFQYLFVAFWYGVFWKCRRFGNGVFGQPETEGS
jgi:hypothetical protein